MDLVVNRYPLRVNLNVSRPHTIVELKNSVDVLYSGELCSVNESSVFWNLHDFVFMGFLVE